MSVSSMVDSILGNDTLDFAECEDSKCQEIEKLIFEYGWGAVQEVMINILLDGKKQAADYEVIAEVFWGAALDNRIISANKVIALLYHRLPLDNSSNENNLAWSIAAKLKKVGYLSDYDPLQDEGVIQARIDYGIV